MEAELARGDGPGQAVARQRQPGSGSAAARQRFFNGSSARTHPRTPAACSRCPCWRRAGRRRCWRTSRGTGPCSGVGWVGWGRVGWGGWVRRGGWEGGCCYWRGIGGVHCGWSDWGGWVGSVQAGRQTPRRALLVQSQGGGQQDTVGRQQHRRSQRSAARTPPPTHTAPSSHLNTGSWRMSRRCCSANASSADRKCAIWARISSSLVALTCSPKALYWSCGRGRCAGPGGREAGEAAVNVRSVRVWSGGKGRAGGRGTAAAAAGGALQGPARLCGLGSRQTLQAWPSSHGAALRGAAQGETRQ